MKIVAKPIQVVAWFNEEGELMPVRFKIKDEDDTENVIRIHRINYCQKEKLAGNLMLVYNCQSIVNGVHRLYELKYEINSCKWMLYKI